MIVCTPREHFRVLRLICLDVEDALGWRSASRALSQGPRHWVRYQGWAKIARYMVVVMRGVVALWLVLVGSGRGVAQIAGRQRVGILNFVDAGAHS